MRKARKIIKVYEVKKVVTIEYNPKEVSEFLQTGYLREGHIRESDRVVHREDGKVEYLKFSDGLVKISPYEEYEVTDILYAGDNYRPHIKRVPSLQQNISPGLCIHPEQLGGLVKVHHKLPRGHGING